ncbi:MAG: gephyrin-like molybdotransferase Glp [Pseudomonadota bacterium]
MLAVEEALERTIAAFSLLPAEWVQLHEALGRVLAEDLVASRDQPPHAISAMDGYAIRAADLASGSATLRLIGAAPAGGSFEGSVGPGETVRIFTGGPLPDGTDAIALQEDASPDGDSVRLEGAIGPGTYVRPAGLDFRRGDICLKAGKQLGPRTLGLAAALNHGWLAVRRKPRIALLATGDELVMPGQALTAHQIVNSNTTALSAMVTAWGGEPRNLGILPDEPDKVAAIVPSLEGADLLVTLGGASVGARDLVRSVLAAEGLDLDFWRIAMRPGKPLMFGRIRDIPMLGLPGNPVSAGVCAILFVRAAICRMLGLDPSPPERSAVLEEPLGANDRRQDYLRASAAWRPDGRLGVRAAAKQDSSMLATFATAQCLIKRLPFAEPAKAGDSVTVLPLTSHGPGV